MSDGYVQQHQREARVRHLAGLGCTDEEIATDIGAESVSAVRGIRFRAGIATSRKPGRPKGEDR